MIIQNAVVHILNKDSEEPIYNEYDIEITEVMNEFLEKHIKKALKDEKLRKASFLIDSDLRSLCSNILLEDEKFIDISKKISEKLFKVLKNSSESSSVDFIVCKYIGENEKKAVALLLLDYNVSYVHDIEMIDSKFKISIKKQEISLPGTNQKIQKGAFISFDGGIEEMVILDTKIKDFTKVKSDDNYFLNYFLKAEIINDQKFYTKLFKKETENWIKEKLEEDTAVEVDEIRNEVNHVLHEEEFVDIDKVSSEAFGNKIEMKEDYVNTLKSKGLELESFEVDRDWVEKKCSKIKLKTDDDIELILPYNMYIEKDKFEVISNKNGTKTILIKDFYQFYEK